MRLLDVSIKTPGLDVSQCMAVGLSGPLGSDGATGPANTAAYVARNTDGLGCWLLSAVVSPMSDEVAGSGADPSPGSGHMRACSMSRPSLVGRWLCACPRAVRKLWPRFQLWCCVSPLARLASSSGPWPVSVP